MITVIGDVHGKFDGYYSIASRSDYSVQVGDFGFSDTWNRLLYSGLSPEKHKVLPGNHDDYDFCPSVPHCLIDFGSYILNDVKFFYIRGGISIDRTYRDAERINGGPKTYWHEEELTYDQMELCKFQYIDQKPDVVISHAPPGILIPMLHEDQRILKRFGFKEDFIENTSRMCSNLLSIHKPSVWVFGHHHKSFDKKIDGTQFIGLDELEVVEI